jgi:rubredoxin
LTVTIGVDHPFVNSRETLDKRSHAASQDFRRRARVREPGAADTSRMADAKECPLCGTVMQKTVRRVADRVPGTNESFEREAIEWVCPECDNYQDAEDDDLE